MRRFRIVGALLVFSVLSGCVGFGVGYDIENLRGAEEVGDAFTRKLTAEYR